MKAVSNADHLYAEALGLATLEAHTLRNRNRWWIGWDMMILWIRVSEFWMILWLCIFIWYNYNLKKSHLLESTVHRLRFTAQYFYYTALTAVMVFFIPQKALDFEFYLLKLTFYKWFINSFSFWVCSEKFDGHPDSLFPLLVNTRVSLQSKGRMIKIPPYFAALYNTDDMAMWQN